MASFFDVELALKEVGIENNLAILFQHFDSIRGVFFSDNSIHIPLMIVRRIRLLFNSNDDLSIVTSMIAAIKSIMEYHRVSDKLADWRLYMIALGLIDLCHCFVEVHNKSDPNDHMNSLFKTELIYWLFSDANNQALRLFYDNIDPRVRSQYSKLMMKLLPGMEMSISHQLMKIFEVRIFQNFDRHATTRFAVLGPDESVPLDDTTGWKTLESDIETYLSILREFLNRNIIFEWTFKMCCVVFQSLVHRNRHIRQMLLTFLSGLFSDMSLKSRREPISIPWLMLFASLCGVCFGCDDNWSQIRREAVLCAYSILDLLKTPCISMSPLHYDECTDHKNFVDDPSLNDEEEFWKIFRLFQSENPTMFPYLCPDTLSSLKVLGNVNVLMLNKKIYCEFYRLLIPRLCLNRFYAAMGVQQAAKDGWFSIQCHSSVFDSKERVEGVSIGRILVEEYLEDVLTYDLNQVRAANHMVAEAACHSLSEILCRLPPSLLTPFVRSIATVLASDALQTNNSWPVRDSCFVTWATLIVRFPEVIQCEYSHQDMSSISSSSSSSSSSSQETEKKRSEIGVLPIFFEIAGDHLKDSVNSVRSNAATCLGELLSCSDSLIAKECYSFMEKFVDTNIRSFVLEKEELLSQRSFIPTELMKKMTQKSVVGVQSILDNNSMTAKGTTYAGWGCCLDCMKLRPCKSWEVTESCILLVREWIVFVFSHHGSQQEPPHLSNSEDQRLKHYFQIINELLTFTNSTDVGRMQFSLLNQLTQWILMDNVGPYLPLSEEFLSNLSKLSKSSSMNVRLACKELFDALQQQQQQQQQQQHQVHLKV